VRSRPVRDREEYVLVRFALAIGLALIASSAFGDEVEQITVTARPPPGPERQLDAEEAREALERTPGGVGMVTSEEIAQTRAADLKDALDFVPGVLLRPRGFGEEPQISIRGSGLRSNFHTRGVNVMIDGVPFQNADGFSDVESFEMMAADRIEVYKGATALRFGGGTLGGALNIVTPTGRDTPIFESRLVGGSFGFTKLYAASGAESERWDVFAAGSTMTSQGYRDHAEQHRERFYGSLGRKLDDGGTLRLDLIAVDSHVELPGSLSRDEFFADPKQAAAVSEAQDEQRNFDYQRAALTLDRPLGEESSVLWSVQWNRQDLYHPLAFAIIDNETYNLTSDARFTTTASLAGRENRFSFGVQAANTRQPERFYANLEGTRGEKLESHQNGALRALAYLSNEHELLSDLSLVLAGRAEYTTRYLSADPDSPADGTARFTALTPSVGLLYGATSTIQLFASYSRAYEPPLLLESVAPGNLDGPITELDAQRGYQAEIGARGSALGGRLRFETALFDVRMRDEIRTLRVAFEPRYENIERSRHTGAELGFSAALTDELSVRAAYTYSRFRYVDDDEFGRNWLPGAPPHYLRAAAEWRSPLGLWIAPQVEWTPTGYYVDSANTEKTPQYALFGLRAGYDHEPWGVGAFFEARNLTNRHYVSAVEVDTDDGAPFQPGDGRAFYLGIQGRFE
jgi:iron complex outermembrane receptor protein